MVDHDSLRKHLADFAAEVVCLALERIEPTLRRVLQDFRPQPQEASTPSNPAAMKRFLDLKEFGAYFGMKPQAARKMVERHRPPPGILVRLGRRIRVDLPAFEIWLARKGVN